MKTLFQSKISSLLVIAVIVVSWLGCANINQNDTAQQMQTLQEQSATQVPCPSSAIQIMPSYKINADGSASWTAVCYATVYQCTRSGKNNQNVSCEQIGPQPVK